MTAGGQVASHSLFLEVKLVWGCFVAFFIFKIIYIVLNKLGIKLCECIFFSFDQ